MVTSEFSRFILAQENGIGAFGIGQIAGVIFILVLIGAIVWQILKKSR